MLNLDTHIVIRYLGGDLRPQERTAVEDHTRGISSIVLWEIAKLHQYGRIPQGIDHPNVTRFIASCRIWPLDVEVALASTRLDFRSDPADEIIAATSVVHKVPLLTRDERLLASAVVPLMRFD